MNPDRRRRRQIWTAGGGAALAAVVGVWTFTLWPGAALICGLVAGPLVGFLYAMGYDYLARR